MDYTDHEVSAHEARIQVVYMHCTDSVDFLNNKIMHKFYEDKIEKSYLIGKKEAFEHVIYMLESPYILPHTK